MRKVTIYTDGAYKSKTSRGGIGFILIDQQSGAKKSCSRGYVNTSSDRMELMAAAEALKMVKFNLKEPVEVELISDSNYLVESVNNKERLQRWLTDPYFMNRKNEDLWKLIVALVKPHKVTFTWVKSHASCEGNRIADALANGGCTDPNPTQDKKTETTRADVQQTLFDTEQLTNKQTHYR
jgi:ribonuclease HI